MLYRTLTGENEKLIKRCEDYEEQLEFLVTQIEEQNLTEDDQVERSTVVEKEKGDLWFKRVWGLPTSKIEFFTIVFLRPNTDETLTPEK